MPDEEIAPWLKAIYSAQLREERIRVAAVAYAKTLEPELADWADDFGEWCAERYGHNEAYDDKMPIFKRSWPAYWKEPVGREDEESDEEDDDEEGDEL